MLTLQTYVSGDGASLSSQTGGDAVNAVDIDVREVGCASCL